LGNTDHLALC